MSDIRPMLFWFNLIGYQVVWFVTVIGAGHGVAWPALVAGGVFVVSQLFTAKSASRELRLLIVALLFGVVIDGIAAHMDWIRYATPRPSVPVPGAPVWILMLWASFAITINRSLIYLRDRWWLASIVGAVGAPFAYLGAQRGWRTVLFQEPLWHGVLWIAASWAIALPLLALLARRSLNISQALRSPSEGATR